jgi:hypothetical protein
VAFVVFMGLCLHRPRRHGPWPGDGRSLWSLRAFTLGLLVGHCVSSPNINSQLLWLSLTLNLAATAYRSIPTHARKEKRVSLTMPEPVAT